MFKLTDAVTKRNGKLYMESHKKGQNRRLYQDGFIYA